MHASPGWHLSWRLHLVLCDLIKNPVLLSLFLCCKEKKINSFCQEKSTLVIIWAGSSIVEEQIHFHTAVGLDWYNQQIV